MGYSLVNPTPPRNSTAREAVRSATSLANSLAMAASLRKGLPASLRRAAL
jgi:hypothetical protein